MTRFEPFYSRWVIPLLNDLGVYDRGLWHKTDDPCLYVFRSKALFDEEMNGIFLHIQSIENPNAIEVVFRRRYSFRPLTDNIWNSLRPNHRERGDATRRSHVVSDNTSLQRGRELIQMAMSAYDEFYNE